MSKGIEDLDRFLACEEAGFFIQSMTEDLSDNSVGIWEIELLFPPFSSEFGKIMLDPLGYMNGKMYKINMYDKSKQFLLIKRVTQVDSYKELTVHAEGKFISNLEYLEELVKQNERK